jgi:hypothetical protein
MGENWSRLLEERQPWLKDRSGIADSRLLRQWRTLNRLSEQVNRETRKGIERRDKLRATVKAGVEALAVV